MAALVTAGGGFLLAVLWFDLMFDVQVRGHGGDELPEPVLASIAAYYARVTTGARPMNRLVALAMVATVVGLIGEGLGDEIALPAVLISVLVGVPPMLLAGVRVVPAAVRLGSREDDSATQSRLARQIYVDHVYCVVAIAGMLAVQAIAIVA